MPTDDKSLTAATKKIRDSKEWPQNLLYKIDPQFERLQFPIDIIPTIEYLLHYAAMNPAMPNGKLRQRTADLIHARYRDGKPISQICEDFGFATRTRYYDIETMVLNVLREPYNKKLMAYGIQACLMQANSNEEKEKYDPAVLKNERSAAYKLGYCHGKTAERTASDENDLCDFPIDLTACAETPNVFMAPLDFLDLPVKIHLCLKKTQAHTVGDAVLIVGSDTSDCPLCDTDKLTVMNALKERCGVEFPLNDELHDYLRFLCR